MVKTLNSELAFVNQRLSILLELYSKSLVLFVGQVEVMAIDWLVLPFTQSLTFSYLHSSSTLDRKQII